MGKDYVVYILLELYLYLFGNICIRKKGMWFFDKCMEAEIIVINKMK